MPAKKSKPIAVPEAEVARQAADGIQGYVYQLHQTVLAWLTLGTNELLHIEFAEDIAVSDDGKFDMTQVKHVAAGITLRSDGVSKLIASLWRFQNDNPGRQVSAALLTTASIGKEKGMVFPGKVPGLVYWRQAARENSDVEPIRKALLRLALPTDLKTFAARATPNELRARIIRPLRWLQRGATLGELDRDIEERLVHFGNRQGVAAEASKNTLDFLVGALLKTIGKPPAERFVTAADLLTIFQGKTFVTVSPGFLEGLSIPSAPSAFTGITNAARDLAQIRLPARAAPRQKLVDRLQKLLVSAGQLWLHGSSGLGKTTLAVLIARSQGVAWLFADLRDLPPAALRSALSGMAETFRRSGVRGLILDDIPAEPDNAVVLCIDQTARAVRDADGVLIITSTKPPQPTLASRLDVDSKTIFPVPYLTVADVEEVVRLGGGDPTWAKSIHAFAGGGHPQLVDARVAGLKQRNWNQKEALVDIFPIKGIPNDMEEERKAVRSRLLQDMDSNATEILLRLSLLQGNFDRPMAMVAAHTQVAVPQAGMFFDFLVGPWIEQVGPERYRVSPLLKDSGTVGLDGPVREAVKANIMGHLIAQRPFPADQLLQVFMIAFQQNNPAGLIWFAHAVVGASMGKKKSIFKRLADEVSVFALFDRGEGIALYPDDLKLSSLLRFAQLRVAIATEDMKRAAILVDRCLFENALLKDEGRQYADAVVWAMVLLEPRIPIPPKRWLAMLLEFIALPAMRPMMTMPLPTGDLYSGIPSSATHDEMLFIARASGVAGIGELADLVEALEELPKQTRNRYLGAASRVSQSIGHIIAASWLAEVKRPDFDAKAAAATFLKLSETDSARENPDLAVELLCAEAIMLDEYANDKDAALGVLRTAQDKYPNDYRINRQRQKVFYRNGEHEKALREFENFADRLPKDRAVDRAYAMREAGRSAAEVGELEKTRLFFQEAWESARLCGDTMRPMVAGLSADCAILDFDAGRTDSALELMQRALLEADPINSKAGLKENYVKRVHIAAILYMRGGKADWPVARQALVVGMCSDPAPQEWFRDQPQPQPAFVWYELAELEAETSDRQSVLTELRNRTANDGLLPMETMLASRLADAALRGLNVDRFMSALNTYPRAVVQGVRHMKAWGGGDMLNQPVGHLAPITQEEWGDASISEAARNAVMSFMIVCGSAERADLAQALRAKIAANSGLSAALRELLAVMDDPSDQETDVTVIVPSIVGRILKGDVFDTGDVFLSAVYILQFLESSVLAQTTADALMKFYEATWTKILAKRTFSMRSPATNGPIILEAMRKGDTPMARLANMVLATEAAVRRGLSDDLRQRFSKIAAKRERPVVTAEQEE